MTGYEGKRLHIVSFDIPVPVNYGGAIDVFYKIQALHKLGIRIHLHCFQYGRDKAPLLEQYCEKVSYYPRIRRPWLHLSSVPYIVSSRRSRGLLRTLLSDNDPVLFEGLHTTSWLSSAELAGRRKVVRTHNIEHQYYHGLAASETNRLKRTYFMMEAGKLQRWEPVLSNADSIAAISLNDRSHFLKTNPRVENISAFHPDARVSSLPGRGGYALYHGSLSVSENDHAARWLVSEVFSHLDIPLVIAGNKASHSLRELLEGFPNISIRENLSSDEIYSLVSNAHINVLPTFQATGIKLKLLAALFRGRHCIVNEAMVAETGLESLCHISRDAQGMRLALQDAWGKEFSSSEADKRRTLLEEGMFSNERNARKLAEIIFE